MRQLVDIGCLGRSDVNIVHGDHGISVVRIDHHLGLGCTDWPWISMTLMDPDQP